MSVAGLCVVFISGWVWSGEVAELIGSGAHAGRLEVQQVVVGEGVYKCVCRWELLLCVGGLSPPFEFMKQWLP